jgi:AcrR family transcriptional regulator
MPRRTKPTSGPRDLETAILDATETLLAHRPFTELSVAEILTTARVSRASFYFYFETKYAVLAALVRRAIGEGQRTAEPWVEHTRDEPPEAEIRAAVRTGAQLWRQRGPVLRAIVENWRANPELTTLWLDLMNGFTTRTAARIERDRAAGITRDDADPTTLAAMLTWLGERVNYLAAIGEPPFDNEDRVVETLTHIWMSTIYPPS